MILARRGQGKFRERVSMIERACRITRVNRPEHLRASDSKPWRDCEFKGQRRYLEYHRDLVFLEARVRRG